MKHLLYLLIGTSLILAGVNGCGQTATGGSEENPVSTQDSNKTPTTQNNNANDVPEDLSGTNLAPPPAPPTP